MRLGNKIKKIICIAAAIAALTMVLSACTTPFADVGVVRKNTPGGGEIPQVEGFMGEDEINKKLSDIFTPYAELAQKAVSDSDGELSVIYTLDKNKDASIFTPEYTLSMGIQNKDKQCIEITHVNISGASRVAYVSQSDISWLGSADVITGAFDLRHMGINVDLHQISGNADQQFAVDLMTQVYEAFVGKKLDVSDIAVGKSKGEVYQKALKLGLITAYYDPENYEYSDMLTWSELQNMAGVMLECIERDAYGRLSESVTGSEFVEMIEFFCNINMVDNQSDSKYLWSDMCAVDFENIAEKANKSDTVIKRRDAAELIWKINKETPSYKMRFNDNALPQMEDSDSIWVRRVMKYNLMNYYGDSILFAPKQDMTVMNALQNARNYVTIKYSDWLFADEYKYNHNYSKYDMVAFAGMILEYFADRPEEDRNSFEIKTVINDRNYNWFYSQQNTGEYSSVNCMPSIATMAAHWYNEDSKATVQKMRATSDVTEGWTAFELRNGLDKYKVPYTIVDATLENIIDALDNGKIILAQYSDRPYNQSGHCYVIYGYKKINNSVTFIINDSDSLTDRAIIFGRKKGNGDELEANFSMWSISRFVSDVTVVG